MSESRLEKVLIIDDSADYRKLIHLFISKLLPDLEVIEHDPVEQGVPDENFKWGDYDVLLLDFDLSIPGVTGLDILQKNYKRPEFPATIMLTGAGTEEVALRAMKTGIFKYQSKQSLTKDKLKQFIVHAHEAKKEERVRQQELTQQNQAFNKEIFYEKLRMASENPDAERVLIVVRPDNTDQLEKNIGVIGRDNLISFIAKKCFEVFKLGKCNPNITRISETAIAIQIDFPDSWFTLEHNMQGLCKHLTKTSFRFADQAHDYRISIGILKLGEFIASPQQLIEIASEAAKKASHDNANSYHIWKDDDVFEAATEGAAATQPATDEKQADTASQEKQRLENELTQAKAEMQARLKAETAARKRLEEEKRAEEDARQRRESELKAEAEARAKAQLEAEMQAAKDTREKLEAELKAISEAKQKAEVEMQALQLARSKLEKEIKGMQSSTPQPVAVKNAANSSAATPATDTAKSKTAEEKQASAPSKEPAPVSAPGAAAAAPESAKTGTVVEESNPEVVNQAETTSGDIEANIKKSLAENRIIQTYQPVISMTDDGHEADHEIYQTGLLSYDEETNVNDQLNDLSTLSAELQQALNQFMLRQIFARITESGVDKTPYRFIINVTESWFTNIALFQWLQKILTQTKKYNPGKAIMINVPLPLYKQHEKRAAALINTLHKSHHFQVALSEIKNVEDIATSCKTVFAKLIITDIESLKSLSSKLAPGQEANKDEDAEKITLLQFLKSNGIRIATKGIEDATLLTDAITAGTDYAIGSFVGETQESLTESTSLESFELT